MNKFIFFLMIVSIPLFTYASNLSDPDSLKDNRFLQRSIGIVIPVYRDFATSPLFYSGAGFHIGYGWLRQNRKKDFLIEIDLNGSIVIANAPRSDFFQSITPAFFINLGSYAHYLHRIERLSNDKNSIKLGAALNLTQNIRINPELQNAAMGLENLANLMVAGRLNRDISRLVPIPFKFLFVQTTLQPVRRYVDIQANIGLLNLNRRPGYAYVYHNEWDGTDTDPASWVLDAYKWSLNGWRLGTRLEYSWFKPSGNGRKISYLWDAAHAPGRHEAFQMASHTLQYTLIINNNKK
ncbi:hypothetical protein [Anditalea andensis]|uniref:Outer membrane protein beta-barrel domain-containing protein n=1 Tax=Anditalea andensis TaxID=1048983 RepID=A0A074KS80_9BACT|nr:hypothetical protein [Anditalea andensis]KEO71769.1 hypothetical protein EL17_21530 [Anditalea andensis]